MLVFFSRLQPSQPISKALVAGCGGFLAVALAGALSVYSDAHLLMAPFGATCVLLFSVPASPLSQPINVIGGHFVSMLIGLLMHMLLPDVWWAAALSVGIAIAVMAALRITHPPAGADPLVVFASDPGFAFLFMPTLAGACLFVFAALVFHKASGTIYPTRSA